MVHGYLTGIRAAQLVNHKVKMRLVKFTRRQKRASPEAFPRTDTKCVHMNLQTSSVFLNRQLSRLCGAFASISFYFSLKQTSRRESCGEDYYYLYILYRIASKCKTKVSLHAVCVCV